MSTDDLPARFAAAQAAVNQLPRAPDTSVMLELYGLYKQGAIGDAGGARPGMFDVKGRAKWDAWDGRRGLTREAAMQAYIALVDRLRAGA